jgi:hypothetical protein
VLVKKGGIFEEQWRAIKTIALPFWMEVMNLAGNEQYLFSEELVPGRAGFGVSKLREDGDDTLN